MDEHDRAARDADGLSAARLVSWPITTGTAHHLDADLVHEADLVVITKTDLVDVLGFDLAASTTPWPG